MIRYAKSTAVATYKSKEEIGTLIRKAGGVNFAVIEVANGARLIFELSDRRVSFDLKLPSIDAFATRMKYKKPAPNPNQHKDWEQACRASWRSMLLCVKAKLASVEAGIETFEEAFLAHIIVMEGGREKKFGAVALPAIGKSYANGGNLPPLLGSGS